jgi:antitoxin (DNA-binding transcriptional repressor) of toxin-antitoxin stability system
MPGENRLPLTIGVRELKHPACRVIRDVREEMAEYVVTLRGDPVAVLRPLTEEEAQHLRQAEIDEKLAEMRALAQEIAAAWSADKSGVELVAEQRR